MGRKVTDEATRRSVRSFSIPNEVFEWILREAERSNENRSAWLTSLLYERMNGEAEAVRRRNRR